MRLAMIAALGVVLAGGAWALWPGKSTTKHPAYPALDLGEMTPDEAAAQAFRLAPALLLRVYEAFALNEEEAIYDTLATAASADALVTLYLERAGALAQSGLKGSDQVVHEMRILRLDTTPDGARLYMDADWQVIGTVGHDEHQHVRGNTYRADLVVEPTGGAWRISDFALRSVDRSLAGTMASPEG